MEIYQRSNVASTNGGTNQWLYALTTLPSETSTAEYYNYNL